MQTLTYQTLRYRYASLRVKLLFQTVKNMPKVLAKGIVIPINAKTMTSQVRQNFHEESEKGINDQISRELHASYVYHAMSCHFNRDDVALQGFGDFFGKQSLEEREHADKLMKYQNKRGGRVVLKDVTRPKTTEWTAESAFEEALELEKEVNQALLDLHAIANKHNDPQMTNFIEEEYLDEQVKSMKEIGDHLTNIRRNGPGLGVYLFDKLTLKE